MQPEMFTDCGSEGVNTQAVFGAVGICAAGETQPLGLACRQTFFFSWVIWPMIYFPLFPSTGLAFYVLDRQRGVKWRSNTHNFRHASMTSNTLIFPDLFRSAGRGWDDDFVLNLENVLSVFSLSVSLCVSLSPFIHFFLYFVLLCVLFYCGLFDVELRPLHLSMTLCVCVWVCGHSVCVCVVIVCVCGVWNGMSEWVCGHSVCVCV